VREVLGTYPYDYDLGPWPAGQWQTVAIELGRDCIRYLTGGDGGEFRSVRISRRPERFAAPPALLIVGEGPEAKRVSAARPFH